MLVLGLGISLGADKLAYSSEEWSAFREYFDSRTELYDYQFDFVIDYESNAEIYEAAGVTQMQQVLLENYNFGVDDSIDEKLLTRLKEEVQKSPDAGGLFRKSFTEALWSLCHIHWLGSSDRPYNLVLLLSGILLLLLSWKKGHRHLLWQVPMCYAAGSVLWMFLLLRDRPVDRVFHPLYLGQIVVFAGIWLLELRREKEMQVSAKENMKRAVWEEPAKVAAAASTALVLTVCAIFVLPAFSAVSKEYADREAVNQTNEAVMAYCMSHSDRLFLEDVYSTVYYSEKISVDRNKPFNYDLLGGWLVKSPLTVKKMSAFGYSGMGEAVLAGENVSLLAETGSDMQWLEDYFLQEGVSAKVIRTGELTQGVEIYQVVSENTGETLR